MCVGAVEGVWSGILRCFDGDSGGREFLRKFTQVLRKVIREMGRLPTEEGAQIREFAAKIGKSLQWARELRKKNAPEWQEFLGKRKVEPELVEVEVAEDDLTRAQVAKESAWRMWQKATRVAASDGTAASVDASLVRVAMMARKTYEEACKHEKTLAVEAKLWVPLSAVMGMRAALPMLTDLVQQQRTVLAGRLPDECRREFYQAYDASNAAWNNGVQRVEDYFRGLLPVATRESLPPLLDGLLLRERVRASEWAEKNLIFPRGTSPNAPGPLSFDRQPYLREIVDCCLDPSVETVFFSGGAQIGKTAALIAILGVIMGQEPSNGVWAMTSLDQVRDFSKKRVMEFIKANECLARYVKPDDPGAFQPLNYQLAHMDVKFVGAGSPANMASTPAAWVIADEAAKYPWINKEEAPPIQLLMERTKAFPRRFHIFCSTPTTVENEFWQGFLSTDMRQYFVPCPFCGGEFVFKFSPETVKWDKPESGVSDLDLAEATTRYICPHCAAEIYDDMKVDMMRKGHWAPSQELRTEYSDDRVAPSSTARGYQLSTMYSPFVSWGKYTRKFLECLQKLTVQTDLQNLKNSWEALPYEFTKVHVKPEMVTQLCSDHRRGEVPGEPYYVCVAYDPGGDETHWVACAVYQGGDMRVIDWGTLLNFRSETHLDEDGRTVVDKPGIAPHFAGLRWGDHAPVIGFVDAGYSTGQIYDECAMMPGVLTPTKGSPTRVGTWNTRPAGPSWPDMQVISYVDFYAKMELYAETIARGRGRKLMLPLEEEVTNDLLNGLRGQRLVDRNNRREWRKVPNDHFGDCIKLCQVGWWALGDRFEDAASLVQASDVGEEGSGENTQGAS